MKTVLSDKVKKAGTIISVPLEMIESAPYRIRNKIENTDKLAESIRVNGIIQPLSVRLVNDKLQIISGERRFAAAKKLGLEAVPCILMNVSDEKSIILSLIENNFSQKNDFHDEANALYILNTVFGVSSDEISELLSKTINNTDSILSFFNFSDEVRKSIEKYGLNDYILSISKLKSDSDRIKFIEYIISKQIKKEELNMLDVNPVVKLNQPNDYRVFLSSVINMVDTMRKAGINAVLTQKKYSGCIECVIRIPDVTSSPVRMVGFSCDAV